MPKNKKENNNEEKIREEEGYEKSEDEGDIYKEGDVEEELEQNEIAPQEAGYAEGYDHTLEEEAEEVKKEED